MIKKLAVTAVLLLSMVACASNPLSSTEAGGSAPLATSAANAPDYILLSSPGSIRTWESLNPEYSLHLRGTMTSAGFVPAGDVQGRGKLCADGQDWLSLTDLKLHKASEGAPVAPYVLGCVNGSSFTPASRTVVTQ